MAKTQDAKKNVKKEALKTPKEKKEENEETERMVKGDYNVNIHTKYINRP